MENGLHFLVVGAAKSMETGEDRKPGVLFSLSLTTVNYKLVPAKDICCLCRD